MRGQTFSKHSAIRAALHRDLVKSGLFDAALGKDYDFLLALRETGDYGGIAQVSTDAALLAIGKAESFIAAVADACPELKKLPQGD